MNPALIKFSVRCVIVYVLAGWLVTHTGIFYRGLDPGDWGGLIVIAFYLFYRFLCWTVVPAIVGLWILEKIWRRIRGTKGGGPYGRFHL